MRTVYGPVPLKFALHWPVFASYDELSGCATWMGGRIPTVEEARSIYDYVDRLKMEEAEQHLGKTVPAVNGYVPIMKLATGISLMITVTSYTMELKRHRHHVLRKNRGARMSSSPTLNLLTWVSRTGIQLLLQATGTNLPANQKWVACGNGQARR